MESRAASPGAPACEGSIKVRVACAAAAAGALAAAAANPASADCRMVRNQVPVQMQGLHPTVTAKVDGNVVRFLLDSGSFFSGISAKLAAAQKMRPVSTPPRTGSRLYRDAQAGFTGVAGGVRAAPEVQADHFEFAGKAFGQAVFVTLPIDGGGLLGQNFLRRADVDYDLGKGNVAMVEVQDCGTASLAYWVAPRAPYSMLVMDQRARGQHVIATAYVTASR